MLQIQTELHSTFGPLLFGSGRGLAEGIATALMLLALAALLGVSSLIAHITIMLKLKNGRGSERLQRWNRGLSWFHMFVGVCCVVAYFFIGGADGWKIIPVGLPFVILGVVGFKLKSSPNTTAPALG